MFRPIRHGDACGGFTLPVPCQTPISGQQATLVDAHSFIGFSAQSASGRLYPVNSTNSWRVDDRRRVESHVTNLARRPRRVKTIATSGCSKQVQRCQMRRLRGNCQSIKLLLGRRNTCSASCFLLLLGSALSLPAQVPFITKSLSVEEVAGGFGFTEGPTPDGEGGILFSDINNSDIHRFDIAAGTTSVVDSESGGANGLLFDAEGRLLVAEGIAQRLTRRDGEGNVEVLANEWDEQPLNSPNDIVVDAAGGIYFTDPGYFNEVQLEGVYYITPQGEMSQVISNLSRPNGIALSPGRVKALRSRANHSSSWAGREDLAV